VFPFLLKGIVLAMSVGVGRGILNNSWLKSALGGTTTCGCVVLKWQ
jgi:hypothetical protein